MNEIDEKRIAEDKSLLLDALDQIKQLAEGKTEDYRFIRICEQIDYAKAVAELNVKNGYVLGYTRAGLDNTNIKRLA